MWCENGLRESARPCCFSAAECLFWTSVVCVREDAARLHQNYHVTGGIVCSNLTERSFIVDLNAPF